MAGRMGLGGSPGAKSRLEGGTLRVPAHCPHALVAANGGCVRRIGRISGSDSKQRDTTNVR
jgi:hypothetical protein